MTDTTSTDTHGADRASPALAGIDASRAGAWIAAAGLALIAAQLGAQICFEYLALSKATFRSRELSSFHVGLAVVIIGVLLIAYSHTINRLSLRVESLNSDGKRAGTARSRKAAEG